MVVAVVKVVVTTKIFKIFAKTMVVVILEVANSD